MLGYAALTGAWALAFSWKFLPNPCTKQDVWTCRWWRSARASARMGASTQFHYSAGCVDLSNVKACSSLWLLLGLGPSQLHVSFILIFVHRRLCGIVRAKAVLVRLDLPGASSYALVCQLHLRFCTSQDWPIYLSWRYALALGPRCGLDFGPFMLASYLFLYISGWGDFSMMKVCSGLGPCMWASSGFLCMTACVGLSLMKDVLALGPRWSSCVHASMGVSSLYLFSQAFVLPRVLSVFFFIAKRARVFILRRSIE